MIHARALIYTTTLILLASPLSAQSRASAPPQHCTIERIVDGDTLICNKERVRLLLIDAPERAHDDYGLRATLKLEEIAPPGTTVRLEYDVQHRDRYQRLLAHLHTPEGLWINLEMVRAGYAHVAVYPPNVTHIETLRAAERQARQRNAGLWATQAFACEPARFRRGRCP